ETRAKITDPIYLARLLRARRKRPRGSAAEQRDEGAAPHSITSSAATSRPGGTVSPIAFAVLRLTTVSKFVGASTGSSAGVAPPRVRPTYGAAWGYGGTKPMG